MDPDVLRLAFQQLQSNIESVRPMHRSSPAVQEKTHQVIGEILTLDIEQLARHPDAATGKLLTAVGAVRQSLDQFIEIGSGAPSEQLVGYLGGVSQWVLSLPGNPTTPPPIFKAAALAN